LSNKQPQPDIEDREVGLAVIGSTQRTYTGIAAELLERFGPERAWPAAWIPDYYAKIFPPRSGPRWQFQREPALVAFVADRHGLNTLDAILAEGVAVFGAERFPSRSALQRMIRKLAR